MVISITGLTEVKIPKLNILCFYMEWLLTILCLINKLINLEVSLKSLS